MKNTYIALLRLPDTVIPATASSVVANSYRSAHQRAKSRILYSKR
jgi:hypothetical protein